MKKSVLVLITLMFCLAAKAQFEAGKWYASTSVTGLNLSYNGDQNLQLGFEAKGGYLADDNLMLLASSCIDAKKESTAVSFGVGGRYYIIQNGLFLGANTNYVHSNGGYNDFMPGVEIGYAFFINGYCTIEPAIYYNQSTKSHKDYSTIGIKIGIGLYK